jgi:hypothetical protein
MSRAVHGEAHIPQSDSELSRIVADVLTGEMLPMHSSDEIALRDRPFPRIHVHAFPAAKCSGAPSRADVAETGDGWSLAEVCREFAVCRNTSWQFVLASQEVA